MSGISFIRSTVELAQITDGTSKTMLVGEKFLNPDRYFDGQDPADDQNILLGMDRDVNGFTGTKGRHPKAPREVFRPQQDRAGLLEAAGYEFGSSHPVLFDIAYCDGSADSVSLDINSLVYYVLGGRNDGEPIEMELENY